MIITFIIVVFVFIVYYSEWLKVYGTIVSVYFQHWLFKVIIIINIIIIIIITIT